VVVADTEVVAAAVTASAAVTQVALAEAMLFTAVISGVDSALLVPPTTTTMVDPVAGGAHVITERSAIDEPRLRPFGGAANRSKVLTSYYRFFSQPKLPFPFELRKDVPKASNPPEPRAVFGVVKTKPFGWPRIVGSSERANAAEVEPIATFFVHR
jgi:hypothetical protein